MEVTEMDRKATGIVSYLTIVGWFVAYFAGDRDGAKFHLNQGLVVHLTFIVLAIMGRIPIIGWFVWILRIVAFFCGVLGVVYAFQDQDKEIPLLGIIKLLK
ncbi:MAG: hypothetical protein HFH99_05360 [Lachnospiraceae bacterium]|jgi:uncharacterized membrane protein|nr:hypothetical protein [Lachnospiraceae bacterium]MCI9571536.1 hypothetical protein [Lachnospiraceae bacterium]MCI9652330.1 hypothetical protein [Lachnospiraceae bacterium]